MENQRYNGKQTDFTAEKWDRNTCSIFRIITIKSRASVPFKYLLRVLTLFTERLSTSMISWMQVKWNEKLLKLFECFSLQISRDELFYKHTYLETRKSEKLYEQLQNELQCDKMRQRQLIAIHITTERNTLQFHAMHYDYMNYTIPHNAIHCDTMRYIAMKCRVYSDICNPDYDTMQYITTKCNVHIAAQCNPSWRFLDITFTGVKLKHSFSDQMCTIVRILLGTDDP